MEIRNFDTFQIAFLMRYFKHKYNFDLALPLLCCPELVAVLKKISYRYSFFYCRYGNVNVKKSLAHWKMQIKLVFLIHQPLLGKPCSNCIRNMSKMLAEKCRDKLRFPHFCPMLAKILDQIWSVTNQLWSLSSYTKFFHPFFPSFVFVVFKLCAD